MKNIKGDIELPTSPDFDIWTEPGKTRTYKGVEITLGRKNYDGIFHYWWFARPFGEPHGFLYKTDATNPELTKLAWMSAKNCVDLMTEKVEKQLKKQGGKKV